MGISNSDVTGTAARSRCETQRQAENGGAVSTMVYRMSRRRAGCSGSDVTSVSGSRQDGE